MSNRPLFISHATRDRELVISFVQLLVNGFGIAKESIFCVTMERPPSGKEFERVIRENLGDAKLVVELLSHNYYESAFCMNEMGAVWNRQVDFLPLLIPPRTRQELFGVVTGAIQVPRIDEQDALSELRKMVKTSLGFDSGNGWESACAEFVRGLDALLEEVEMTRLGKKHDLFISAPMSSIPEDAYPHVRTLAMALGEKLVGSEGYYFAGRDHEVREKFDERDVAAKDDLAALKSSLAYVLLVPVNLLQPSSIHYEAGVAVERGIHTTFIHQADAALPFMMAEANSSFRHVKIKSYSTEERLLKDLDNPKTARKVFPGRRTLLRLEKALND